MLSHAKSYYKSLSRTTRLMILGCSLIKDDERSPLVKLRASHTRVLRPTPSCSREAEEPGVVAMSRNQKLQRWGRNQRPRRCWRLWQGGIGGGNNESTVWRRIEGGGDDSGRRR